MKKLSKIVALLLAGAMAMLMFTACSGGGGGADTQKEEAIRAAMLQSQFRSRTSTTPRPDNINIFPRRAIALRGFLRLVPAQSRPLVAPPREKAMPEDPQIFRHCKFRIIFPLLMRTAHAARISNRLF